MPFDFKRKAKTRQFFSPKAYRAVLDRERYYSLFVTVAVKILLFIFLWVLFGKAIQVMDSTFRNIGGAWRIILPGVIAVIAVVVAWNTRKNIKEILGLRKELQKQRRK